MSEPQSNQERKRKKVLVACLFCRRLHMICDNNRPCARCIKRNIAHLCHDEPQKKPKPDPGASNSGVGELKEEPFFPETNSGILLISQLHPFNQQNPFFFSEHANSEFSLLNEFLLMIDDPDVVNSVNTEYTKGLTHNGSYTSLQALNTQLFDNPMAAKTEPRQTYKESETPMISESAKDKFFLTAADPSTEITPEERLKQVIKAKLDAGLLQPYNYAEGYARLQNYMDKYMNQQSRVRIQKPLLVFRPAFRAIARTLKDVDLILVEEAFERMLLDYDRVFTLMAIPACLWRRTGEIYRGNKEFAQLVEVNSDALKDGKLTIYELMTEESAVNFWEKYGAIAFDKGQKAVLTSCNLRTRDGRKRKACCFNFTIRRDRYNIPSCIVGNFIPIDN